jgi:hypothetical protein
MRESACANVLTQTVGANARVKLKDDLTYNLVWGTAGPSGAVACAPPSWCTTMRLWAPSLCARASVAYFQPTSWTRSNRQGLTWDAITKQVCWTFQMSVMVKIKLKQPQSAVAHASNDDPHAQTAYHISPQHDHDICPSNLGSNLTYILLLLLLQSISQPWYTPSTQPYIHR